MRGAVEFLFGSGWWIPWHLFLLSALLPLGVLLTWFARFDPDGGPQGGEAALALLFLVLAILMLGSLLHAGLWARGQQGGIGRYVRASGVWLAGWVVLLIPIIKLANLAASTSAERPARTVATVTLGLLLLAVLAANLLFLWRYQRR